MKSEKVPSTLLRYPADLYLSIDFGEGEDYEYGYRQQEFVSIRKPRMCFMGRQEHAVGTIMVKESALVDGQPQTCYCCLACAARYIDFDEGIEDEEEEVINPHSYHCDGARWQKVKELG